MIHLTNELRRESARLNSSPIPPSARSTSVATSPLSAALLPGVIERLADQHPGVITHVTQMSRPITLEIRHLRERTVDFIVGRGVFPIPEDDLNAEILFEEPLLVVAGAQSSWARRRKLELADLVDGKWIQFPLNEAAGVMVEQAFGARGLAAPSAIVRTSSFLLRYTLLTMGDYLTVIPACMLRVFNAKFPAVKALSVNLGTQPRPVAIFILKNRTLSPVADLVIKCVRFVAERVACMPTIRPVAVRRPIGEPQS